MTTRKSKGDNEARIASAVAAVSGAPRVKTRVVTDSSVIERAGAFDEFQRQAQPIAAGGTSSAASAAKAVQGGAGHPQGVSRGTATRYVTSPHPRDSLLSGANPRGKAAEVVAASEYRALHGGKAAGIVNPPERVATNVHDVRVSPDPSSRKDLFFAYETNEGKIIWKYNGQVKTGGARYVSDKLVKMASTPGYGKIGYVDARFVNADGTPRVAPDAFTEVQARRLQDAKVRLRGIRDLETRAQSLLADVKAHSNTGLDPIAQQRLLQLRDDIAAAYRSKRVAGRVAVGAGTAAASAAVAALAVQLVSGGEVDLRAVGRAAASGAAAGAGGTVADAALYQAVTRLLGQTPEAAKALAQQGVAAAFCVLAIGADVLAEVGACRRADVTLAGATGGGALKVALNLLPFVLRPLGIAGMPLLVGAQVGGRWLVAKARERDSLLEQAIEADRLFAAALEQRMDDNARANETIEADCAETDELFALAMTKPTLKRTVH